MELCLGTVQFGMDYGVNNKKRPPVDQSIRMLDYAVQNGVYAIDTAAAYGNAEEIVGSFLRKKTIPREKLYITTKLLPNSLDECGVDKYRQVIRDKLIQSLNLLGIDYVDGFMFHSSRYAFEPAMIDALHEVCKEGLAIQTGVSVYAPDEAFSYLRNYKNAIIQAPYSLLDHRMKQSGLLERVAEMPKLTFCTRSAFLQGLVLMDEDHIPPHLTVAVPLIRKLREISHESNISIAAMALGYVRRESSISYLVFGIHSLEQLKENVKLFEQDTNEDVMSIIDHTFQDIDAEIIIPSLWEKKRG